MPHYTYSIWIYKPDYHTEMVQQPVISYLRVKKNSNPKMNSNFTSFCFLTLCIILNTVSATDINVDIHTDSVLHVTDERFLSVVLGSTVIRHNWSTLDFSSPKVRTLAMGLAPAILRVGGSEADLLIFNQSSNNYDVDQDDESYDFLDYGYESIVNDPLKNFSMSPVQWDQLNQFVSSVGWNLLFDLNVLLRRGSEWDAANTLELLKYSIEKNYTSNVNFELGNEPNALKHFIHRSLDASQLGKDFLQLHYILRSKTGYSEHFTNSLLVGPDTTKPQHDKSKVLDYMNTFLRIAGDSLSGITWHQYYIDGRTATASDFLDPNVLSLFYKEALRVKKVIEDVGLQHKPLMLGETGSCWGGGAPNLSNRYAGGFLWLDKLGLAAQTGHSIVMRQTFYEGNYGLLDKELFPTPDYWLSLVFKTLVGTKVFNTSTTDSSQGTRVYAHCTHAKRSGYPKGALTIYALNVHSTSVGLKFSGALENELKHVYWFLPHTMGDMSSKYVDINGKKMEMPTDTTFPDIKPVVITTARIALPPTSFGFIVFPKANISNCLE